LLTSVPDGGTEVTRVILITGILLWCAVARAAIGPPDSAAIDRNAGACGATDSDNGIVDPRDPRCALDRRDAAGDTYAERDSGGGTAWSRPIDSDQGLVGHATANADVAGDAPSEGDSDCRPCRSGPIDSDQGLVGYGTGD
jgi:hypothetical protein